MTSDHYPDYRAIMDARERRTRQEIEGGRQQVMKNMAEGVIERIKKDYGLDSVLDSSQPDPRNWTVRTVLPKVGTVHVCKFFSYPSNELLANIMLLEGDAKWSPLKVK